MINFAIKDVIDILLVGLLLFYLYRTMKKSGTIKIFVGVMAFVVVWILASEVFGLRLTGSILDKFMAIGLIVLVILFQDQIKRFLIDLGSHEKWNFLHRLFHHQDTHSEDMDYIMPVVYACMGMSKSKTGALIVFQRRENLIDYEKTGDMIDANVNARLIDNIFFKNSPLHDGAMIIADRRIAAAGCILPVSHDMHIPKELGLRHRAALGMCQVTDAVCVIVSEETGNISMAVDGKLKVKLTTPELEHALASVLLKDR